MGECGDWSSVFFFQAEDGIRDIGVTGVQTCALPICIYRTTDAGRTWTRTFTNRDPRAFFDCMAFWPGGRRGLAVSDPVTGKFRILRTADGGASWSVADRSGMPRAVDGEFAFAASGTCLVTSGWRDAYLASGGGAARVFHTANRGRTWTVTDSTIPASEAGGVFSLAF